MTCASKNLYLASSDEELPRSMPYRTSIADFSPSKVLVATVPAQPVRLLVAPHGSACTSTMASSLLDLVWVNILQQQQHGAEQHLWTAADTAACCHYSACSMKRWSNCQSGVSDLLACTRALLDMLQYNR